MPDRRSRRRRLVASVVLVPIALAASAVIATSASASGATDPTTSTVVASPSSVHADGTSSATITVTLLDSSDDPVAGDTVSLTPGSGSSTVSAASGPSSSSGAVTFTVTDTTAETVTYTAEDTSQSVTVTETATVTFTGPPSASNSTVSASTTSLPADGTTESTITVTLLDANDNPVVGDTVSLSGTGSSAVSEPSGPSDSSGQVTFTVTDTTAETDTYTAEDTTQSVTVTQTATVTFSAPVTSPSDSTVSASPTSVSANGTASSTITVTLLDSSGGPVAGDTVSLTPGSGSSHVSSASGPSSTSGVVTFTVTDSHVQDVTYTAEDTTQSVTLDQTATVDFTDPPGTSAANSTVTAAPDGVPADGTTESTITVTLLDSSDDPVVGDTVSLTPGSGSSTVSSPSGASNSSGVVTFTVKDTSVEDVTYTAEDTTQSVTLDQTATVDFTAPETSASESTVTATPGAVTANGTASSTVTVTLLDPSGGPVAGDSVALSQDGSSIITGSPETSNASGEATFTVTDTNVEDVTYTGEDTTQSVYVSETAVVDFISTTSGAISGTVTASTGGGGISGAWVYAYEASSEDLSGYSETASNGSYTISGLSPGSYDVEFEPPDGANYLSQWYDDQSSQSSATSVTVTGGSDTASVDAALVTGGSITGTVTAATGGAPVSGAYVDVYQGDDYISGTTTASDGTYTVDSLTGGDYEVEFENPSGGNYLDQWYNDQTSQSSATSVAVTTGSTTSGIDAALVTGGSITGTVTAATGGAAVANVEVEVYQGASYVASADTASDGTYTVDDLASGSYTVEFDGSEVGNYLIQWYDAKSSQSSANTVSVTAGSTTSGIDAALVTGGTITGTVTAATGGAAVANVEVEVYQGASYVTSVDTASDGTYTVDELASGSYTVEFDGSEVGNYLIQWYDNQTSQSSATSVAVTAGSTTSGIDAALVTGGTISGTVTAASGGSAISDAYVDVYQGSTYISGTTTTSNGSYSVDQLPTGSYTVEFGPPSGDNYLAQFYDAQSSQSSADTVSVTAGSTTSGINAALVTGGQITGTVTASTGGGDISGAWVYVYQASSLVSDASTASNGTYTIDLLPTGSYTVEFEAPVGTNFFDQWYDAKTSQASANAVSVTAGSTVSGINAALVSGGEISGTVTAATGGGAISGACVYAYPAGSDTWTESTCTASDGTYTIDLLTTGSYDVEFEPPYGGNYFDQWYNNATSQSGADSVSVTAGSTTTGIDAALVTAGAISGTVTAATGGGAISSACVYAYPVGSDSLAGSSCTGSDGTYAIGGLTTGSYDVEFEPPYLENYMSQWFNDAASQETANGVSVTIGSTTTSINAALATGGEVTGTVTAATGGAPVADVEVDVYQGGSEVGWTQTAADGTYTVDQLPTGVYQVYFDSEGLDYFSQWYNGAASQSSANAVNITLGSVTSSIDAELVTAGSVSGTVTAATGGGALSGVDVYAYQGSSEVGEAETAANGTYTLGGLTSGSYDIEFYGASAGNYLTQWYSGATSQSAAAAVSVTAGSTTSSINAQLGTGGEITGTVTAASGGAAVAGIYVDLYQDATYVAGTTTASDGTYSFEGLATGSYTVEFTACYQYGSPCDGYGGTYEQNFVTQWYDDQSSQSSATSVSVTAGSTTSSIDAALATGGEITGTVTAASGGADISYATVSVYEASTGSLIQETSTSSDGTYTLEGLPTGTYDVEFTPPYLGNYIDQWYDDQSSQSSATSVSVTAGSTTSSIDAALATGGEITGTVTAATGGADLSDAYVCAYPAGNLESCTAAFSASDGTYAIVGLPSGTYDVEFYAPYGENYLDQWYDGATSESTASPVTVTAGSTTPAIDAALATAGEISGTVTAATGGSDLEGVCVTAYSSGTGSYVNETSTAFDGTYTLEGLPTGSYDVDFETGCGVGNYVAQWYDDASSQSSATALNVTAGSTVSSVDAALAGGGAISGTVTDASGGGLGGICVTAVPAGGGSGAGADSAGNGSYTIDGLSTGDYDVEFTSCGSGNYLTQWYDGVSSAATATEVSVSEGSTTQSIDATMSSGGEIAGTVTAASGGADLDGVCVDAFVAGGSVLGGSATTATNGAYVIDGLSTGDYDVEFLACGSGNYLDQWYDNAQTESSATSVGVTSGSTTSSIDAEMAGGAAISGTVTAAAGGGDLAGICVDAYSVGGSTVVGSATSLGDGEYTIDGLSTGSYDVEFSACDGGNYLTQWYDDKAGQSSATSVSATVGSTTGSINAEMVAGGVISGTVTAAAGGAPIQGICVNVFGAGSSTVVGEAASGSDGTYSISGLVSGSYDVEFSDGCDNAGAYVTQWYVGASGESTATPVGATTSDVDASMVAGTVVTSASASADPDLIGSSATYTVGFTTSATGALTGGSSTVTLDGTLGAGGTVFPPSASDYTVNGTEATVVDVSGEAVAVTVPASIPASTAVTVAVSSVTNPTTPSTGSGDYLEISTSADQASVLTYYTIASSVSTITVSAFPNGDAQTATYTVAFDTSSTGALTGGTSTVTLDASTSAPGTIFPASTADYTVNGVAVSAAPVLTNANETVTVTVPSSVGVGSDSEVTLVVSEVTNPEVTGSYGLDVCTSSDQYPTESPVYPIATGVTGVSTSTSTDLAGATATYTVGFTTSVSGALTGGTSTITLDATYGANGTVFPTAAADYVVNGVAVSSVLVTANETATFTVPAGDSVGASTGVSVVVSGVTNPAAAGNDSLVVYTSSDVATEPSTTYSILTEVADPVVSLSDNIISATGSTYTVTFTTSVSGALAAGTQITLDATAGAPGTIFQAAATDYTVDGTACSAVTVTGSKVSVTMPTSVGDSTKVDVVILDVTNPATASGDDSLAISTSSDVFVNSSDTYVVGTPVGPPAGSTSLTVGDSNTTAGGSSTYTFAFTTSTTGALADGSSTINVEGPNGMGFPAAASDYLISDPTPATTVQVDPAGCTAPCAEVTVPAGLAPAIGNSTPVTLEIESVTNPSTAGTYSALISTSSDQGWVVTETFTIAPAAGPPPLPPPSPTTTAASPATTVAPTTTTVASAPTTVASAPTTVASAPTTVPAGSGSQPPPASGSAGPVPAGTPPASAAPVGSGAGSIRSGSGGTVAQPSSGFLLAAGASPTTSTPPLGTGKTSHSQPKKGSSSSQALSTSGGAGALSIGGVSDSSNGNDAPQAAVRALVAAGARGPAMPYGAGYGLGRGGGPPGPIPLARSIPTVAEALRSFSKTIGGNGLLSFLLIFLIGLPAIAFNSALKEHHHRLASKGRIRNLLDRTESWLEDRHPIDILMLFSVVGAVLYALDDPTFGLNASTVAEIVGFCGAIIVTTVVTEVGRGLYVHRRFQKIGDLRAFPIGLAVAVVFDIFSRLSHFEPGYVFGIMAAIVFRVRPTTEEDGRSILHASIWLFVVAALGWLAYGPVNSAVVDGNHSFGLLVLESLLSYVWVCGLQSLFFGLIPVRNMDGKSIFDWSRAAWTALYVVVTFVLVQFIIHPSAAGYGANSHTALGPLLAIFIVSAVAALAFWTYVHIRFVRRSGHVPAPVEHGAGGGEPAAIASQAWAPPEAPRDPWPPPSARDVT